MMIETHRWMPNQWRNDLQQYFAQLFDVPESHSPGQTGRGWELWSPGLNLDDESMATFTVGKAVWLEHARAIGSYAGRTGQWAIAKSPRPMRAGLLVDARTSTFTVDASALGLHDYVILRQMVAAFLARYAEVTP